MNWPSKYICLKKKYPLIMGKFSISPIRHEDRISIMKWRNEQLFHLRQKNILTRNQQNKYFDKIIKKQFHQENPDQILFSFLKCGECVGYGGLVHIDWLNKNAEISFVMNTELEKKYFEFFWGIFLNLVEQVAFLDLKFNKIFVYSYNLRPLLYKVMKDNIFKKEGLLKNHVIHNNNFIDVFIHSKFNNYE